MSREITRVEDSVDAEGYIVSGYSMWLCDCGAEVFRVRGQGGYGQGDVSCGRCGQPFNASGQRLRWDYHGTRSNYDGSVSDMEGFELQHAGDS